MQRKTNGSTKLTAGAFTLVELLVVVTIIVILLALLAPAMDKAISQAENLKCAVILKQMGNVSFQYSLTYRGLHLPESTNAATTLYFENTFFREAMGISVNNPPAYCAPKGLICPRATWVLNNPGNNEGLFSAPTGNQPFYYRIDLAYGMNQEDLPDWSYPSVRAHRVSKVHAPARKFFMGDATWSDLLYWGNKRYAQGGENFDPSGQTTHWAIAWRHGGEQTSKGWLNVLLFDGSTERLGAGMDDSDPDQHLNDATRWDAYGDGLYQ